MKKSKTVLIIDDNKDILFSIKTSLETAGCKYQFITSESARKALGMITKDKPDLILLDLMMPEMDGWEFAAAVKNDPDTKDIPIIIITAKGEMPNRLMGKFVSEFFIQKPFDPSDLKAKINSVIG
jgi:CheY-like chemotaxis protein